MSRVKTARTVNGALTVVVRGDDVWTLRPRGTSIPLLDNHYTGVAYHTVHANGVHSLTMPRIYEQFALVHRDGTTDVYTWDGAGEVVLENNCYVRVVGTTRTSLGAHYQPTYLGPAA